MNRGSGKRVHSAGELCYNARRDKEVCQLEKQSALADARLEKSQAITDTKLEELTREVRQHNSFAKRIPVLEEKIAVANHRINDLEQKGA